MRGWTCDIYGAPLRVEADDGPALRALARVLHGFPSIQETAGAARLSLRFTPQPLLLPETDTPLFRWGEARALAEGSRLWLTDGWSRLVVDAEAGCGEGDVHPGSWTGEARWEDRLLRPGLLALLRGQGCFPLRATWFLEGGITALAVPVTGSDLTWFTQREAASGEVHRGAGAVLLRDHGGCVTAGIWPAAPTIQPEAGPDAVHSLPPSTAVSQQRMQDVAACNPPNHYLPELLLFGIERPGATRLEPLSPREALAALLPASPLLLTHPGPAGPHLETLRRLVAQCRCYRLYHAPGFGRHPGAFLDLLPALAARG